MTRSSGYSLRNARLFRVWSIFVLLSTVLVLLWTPVTPTLAMPSTGMYVIGHSVQGRPIQAIRFGTGSRIVVITGAIHGGTETNTADLVNRLVARFETEDVRLPADLSLYLVPMINPDGVAHNTRYNANRVDLNRNWPTDDWQPDSVDASGVVPGGGGSAPLSEPESQALATWLLNLRQQASEPPLVLFYHSQYPPYGLVLPGSAGASTTEAFAQALGYSYSGVYSEYPVTGEVVSWCQDESIRCFEAELPNRQNQDETTVERHFQAIISVLLYQQNDGMCFTETGFCISGRIRDFWAEQDGLVVFGLPISGLQTEVIEGTPVQVQWFERVRLELHPQQDVPYDVLVSRLGVDLLMNQGRDWWLFPQSEPATDCLFFEQTSKNLCSPFLEAWRERGLELDGQPGFSDNESLALLGMPISDAQLERLSDGAQYQVQWFERGRLELHPQQPAPFTVQSGLLGREMEIYRTNERLQPLRRDD